MNLVTWLSQRECIETAASGVPGLSWMTCQLHWDQGRDLPMGPQVAQVTGPRQGHSPRGPGQNGQRDTVPWHLCPLAASHWAWGGQPCQHPGLTPEQLLTQVLAVSVFESRRPGLFLCGSLCEWQRGGDRGEKAAWEGDCRLHCAPPGASCTGWALGISPDSGGGGRRALLGSAAGMRQQGSSQSQAPSPSQGGCPSGVV